MFRHVIEKRSFGEACVNAMAAAFLMGTSILPILSIALVTIR